ncbi:MAG: peptidyl-prolyl cis-trans isomerase [Ignavibacteriales bacterium]|nr:peptidyl-prolyl cis-trans isomerase [Ignavibacteriales bacterium]
MIRFGSIIYLSILLIFGCKTEKKESIIARVGDVTLTKEEIHKQFAGFDSLSETEFRQFVQQWINEELLYQEAVRAGVEETPEYKEQLMKIKKQITTQQFIEREIYSDSSMISDSLARNYFENHRDEFSIRQETIRLQIANFSNREGASAFAASLAKGIAWDSSISIIKNDSLAAADFLGEVLPGYFTEHTLLPTELWKVASTLSMNDISFPVKSSFGYSIIVFLERKQKGDAPVYDAVSSEVKERLTIDKKRKTYQNLLESLYKRYRVETFFTKDQPLTNQK